MLLPDQRCHWQRPHQHRFRRIFKNSGGLTSITIPGSVNTFGSQVFFGCAGLTNVIIDSGATTIGYEAFVNCQSIPSVTIPDSVTGIGSWALSTCSSLTNVAIGSGVTNIGEAAFAYCTKLPAFTVDPQNQFYSSPGGVLFDKNQTTMIQFPTGAGGSYTIPGSVANIEDYAFAQCVNLTSVTIPDSVISMNTYAFYSCASLTNVTIPDSVASIGNYAFYYCTSLASVTIGSGVTNVGDSVFGLCQALKSVYFRGNAPVAGSTVFTDDSATAYYLPGTTGWDVFTTNADIPTTLWLPRIQTRFSGAGTQTNLFAFNINWAGGQTVTVEACTNLSNPDWEPLQTNKLTGSFLYFSDPQWTNYPARFYRISSP